MSGNLVPERIVNKNGVHTTVYRKPGSAAAKKALDLPALSLVPRVNMSDDEMVGFLSTKIRAASREQYSGVNDVDQPTIIRSLKKYSPTTIRNLCGFLDSPELDRAGSDASIVAHSIAKGEDETFISDCMNFFSVQGKSSLIRSLRYYPQLTSLPVDIIDQDSELHRNVRVLMDMADLIRRTHESNYSEDQVEAPYETMKTPGAPGGFVVLTDDRLVSLILDRPDEEMRIRGIIEDHDGTDYEVIVDALENGSALGAGTL